MNIHENVDLTAFNTFRIKAVAEFFATFQSPDELGELITAHSPRLILGGGSNVLLTGDVRGLVMKNEVKGIDVVSEDIHHVYVRAGGGEVWHDFVEFCIARDLAGAENLSLIPGSVGASPMQNIGAYGVELKDIFHQLDAYDLHDRTVVSFSNVDCGFGYRESVFKKELKDRFVILNVTFRLNKTPVFNTSYGAISEELERMNAEPSIRSISQAVINIRRFKLPDPAVIGNAGSFFKNPTVSTDKWERLRISFPSMPAYHQPDGTVKIAAGWMIEDCGWKGYREGDAGCHARQALVLVNYGHATGAEILALSDRIADSVHQKFDIRLEREVNII